MAGTAVRLPGEAVLGLLRNLGQREVFGLAWFNRLRPGFLDVL